MPITIQTFQQFKKQKTSFACLTAYNYSFAKIIDEIGIPLILVGDSLGMVEQGLPSTVPVSLDSMISAGKAVKNACKNAFVAIDMPFLSCGINPEYDLLQIKKVLQNTLAHGVKIEGAHETVIQTIKQATSLGIPVLGHIGLTPQHINALTGFSIQGKTEKQAEFLEQQAKKLEQAGVFAIVLELVEKELARKITSAVNIPTIGIGSGPHTDGQILVINDILGLSDYLPKHAKIYTDLKSMINKAVSDFTKDVSNKNFP